MFITPSRRRNVADTEEPIMPPICEKLSKRLETAAAVAATTIDVTITMLALRSVLFSTCCSDGELLTLSGRAKRTFLRWRASVLKQEVSLSSDR